MVVDFSGPRRPPPRVESSCPKASTWSARHHRPAGRAADDLAALGRQDRPRQRRLGAQLRPRGQCSRCTWRPWPGASTRPPRSSSCTTRARPTPPRGTAPANGQAIAAARSRRLGRPAGGESVAGARGGEVDGGPGPLGPPRPGWSPTRRVMLRRSGRGADPAPVTHSTGPRSCPGCCWPSRPSPPAPGSPSASSRCWGWHDPQPLPTGPRSSRPTSRPAWPRT